MSLRLYDVSGSLVATLVDAGFEPGRYRVPWCGRDISGAPLATGVYFLGLATPEG